MSGVEQWLGDVATAALVGSARREPPPIPAALGVVTDDEGHAPEHRLLASAALADAVTRGGAGLQAAGGPTHDAPPETREACSEAAAQLVHLLLLQPPVSMATRDELVVEWLRLAEAAGQRAPFAVLPALLEFAAPRPSVARALGGVIGERGAWLVGLNAAWSATLDADRTAPVGSGGGDDWTVQWSTMATAEATAAFAAGRRTSPAAARALLEAEWDTVSAKVRGEAVVALRHGISAADEPLLERALDDRAKTVREAAAGVLSLLPASDRADRMAARLRGLVRVRGTLSRHLEVEVPDPPDDAAVRDGMTPPAKGGGPPPTVWLAQVVRGAPLSTWTEITGRSVAATLKMVRDKDVLASLVEAVLDRRDAAWALACVEHGVPDPRLVWLLPQEKRTDLLVSWVARPPAGRDLGRLLVEVPRPWPDELSRVVLGRLRGEGATTSLARAAAPLLPVALSPSLAPAVTALLEQVPADATHLRRALTETLQLHAFRTSLTEAFR
ncbi:hypothetical protein SAMN05192575_107165 [Nocardioides alpinus]|uniref:Uncharacterized protein n=1 Tax=Nocardioides alpinus TaxID=748909 RepID=A0A1I1A6M0_9ACTN|nr:DUF5691 domain-containing protein [Nocardioides alpinus]PKH42146.1 hypothetical protein CXG46_06620 [Nocardioides alpinus]SFB32208.1 hypothetical protein SAMN05192575_107165 [Nocardioides alpinus]